MGFIVSIECDNCGLRLERGVGYALNAAAERIAFRNQLVSETIEEFIERVTGCEVDEARAKRLLGYEFSALCFACTQQFRVDTERDAKPCPNCGSPEVRTINDAWGERCPRCLNGVLVDTPSDAG